MTGKGAGEGRLSEIFGGEGFGGGTLLSTRFGGLGLVCGFTWHLRARLLFVAAPRLETQELKSLGFGGDRGVALVGWYLFA